MKCGMWKTYSLVHCETWKAFGELMFFYNYTNGYSLTVLKPDKYNNIPYVNKNIVSFDG